MMIEHHRVHSSGLKPINGFIGGGTTIDGEQEMGWVLGETVFHTRLTPTVAFIEPVGEVMVDLPAEFPQHFGEDGGGGDSVHVVIAEDYNRFTTLASRVETVHGRLHVRQKKWIGKVFQ